jgi:hypothetical protein
LETLLCIRLEKTMATADSRNQINVRLSPEQVRAIDQMRVELQKIGGTIPTRSDVLRLALDAYLVAKAHSKT